MKNKEFVNKTIDLGDVFVKDYYELFGGKGIMGARLPGFRLKQTRTTTPHHGFGDLRNHGS